MSRSTVRYLGSYPVLNSQFAPSEFLSWPFEAPRPLRPPLPVQLSDTAYPGGPTPGSLKK